MTETKDDIFKSTEVAISLESESGFDPKEYYKDRKDLYVFSGFERYILPDANVLDANTSYKVRGVTLAKDANDAAIENALGTDHLFSETAVAAIIADLIEKQKNGEEGILLNDGYANIFYTPSCVVGVDWRSFSSEWSVFAWGRGECDWLAGYRVFSPAT